MRLTKASARASRQVGSFSLTSTIFSRPCESIWVNSPEFAITPTFLSKSAIFNHMDQEYQVAGWASVNEGTEGPPIWEVVANYLTRQKTVRLEPNRAVKVTGA